MPLLLRCSKPCASAVALTAGSCRPTTAQVGSTVGDHEASPARRQLPSRSPGAIIGSLAFRGPAVAIGRMKLLLLNGNTDSAMSARLAGFAAKALARLGAAGVDVVPATARFGARYIASRASATIAGHAVLDALAARIGRHNPDGFDAAIIACFGDPGLEAAKELCPVPVIGMAEASLAVGMRWAPRIAFLTGGAAWVPMLEEFCLLRGFGP